MLAIRQVNLQSEHFTFQVALTTAYFVWNCSVFVLFGDMQLTNNIKVNLKPSFFAIVAKQTNWIV
jgi:hypothetical protein